MISEGKDQNSDFENDRIRKNVSQHCENAKERKAHVDKIALYMELWSAFSVFVLPAKVAGLFWKTNEAKKWAIRDASNVLYGNYTYPLELSMIKSRLV